MYDEKSRHTCLVFTCMQVASTVGSPGNVHRAGNFAIPFIHEWIRAYVSLAKAPRKDEMFPPFSSVKESLLYSLQTKSGAAKITECLRKNKLIQDTEVYLSPCMVGGILGMEAAIKTLQDRIELATGERPTGKVAHIEMCRQSGMASRGMGKGRDGKAPEWMTVVEVNLLTKNALPNSESHCGQLNQGITAHLFKCDVMSYTNAVNAISNPKGYLQGILH
jgi:hypothetical protein